VFAIQAFLRDEFSEENVIFWQKCEQYRKSTDAAYRKQLARLIYADHVAESSTDQVNIDADVRQTVERRLSTAAANLFDDAQRHVYLLMKYDPYPRYVKARGSAAVAAEVAGLLPPPFEELEVDPDSAAADEKDQQRRWSLLPNWLADRRRRVGGEVEGRGGGGFTRFIKRLSTGDRKTLATVAPAPRHSGAPRPAEPPLTPAGARPQPPPLTGTCSKRRAVEPTRTLSSRRSTSVLGLNVVGTAAQKAPRTAVRPQAQRAIRWR